jgi:ankyrin repeat protein
VLLERYNASCNHRSYDVNASVLHFAARGGNPNVVKLILERNKQLINSRTTEGDTPLMWSALEGNLKVSMILLQSGADPFAINTDKATPLICSAMVHMNGGGRSGDAERAILIKTLLDAAIKLGDMTEYINRQDIEGKEGFNFFLKYFHF